jgi:hypothetical protein
MGERLADEQDSEEIDADNQGVDGMKAKHSHEIGG